VWYQPIGTLNDLAALLTSRRLHRCLGGVTFGLAARVGPAGVLASMLGLTGVARPMHQRAAVCQHPLAAYLAAADHLVHFAALITPSGMSGEFTGHLRNSRQMPSSVMVHHVPFANMAEREFVDWWEVQVGTEATYLASHPSANATAVMPHEMRSAVNLNHSR
jgi:hypothetical protein